MTPAFRKAIFLQFGATIGSGIFILPYVFYHSNFIFASIFFLLLITITVALNSFYCYIVSHTSGDHQLSGYARIYLNSRFASLIFLNLIILSLGSLTAYLKLFSSFTSLLFSINFLTASILFIFILFFLKIVLDNRRLQLASVIPFLSIVIPLFLLFTASTQPSISHLGLNNNPSFIFYAPLLFALSNFTIIPEIDEVLRENYHQPHESLFWASTTGTILASIIYLIFIVSIIFLSSPSPSVNSISSLSNPIIQKTVAIFGVLAVVNAAYHFLGVLHELFYRDFNFSSSTSTFLAFIFPLLSFFSNTVSLLTVISITGSITIFISALAIILIRLRLIHGFWTDFFAVLILICLIIGLFISFF